MTMKMNIPSVARARWTSADSRTDGGVHCHLICMCVRPFDHSDTWIMEHSGKSYSVPPVPRSDRLFETMWWIYLRLVRMKWCIKIAIRQCHRHRGRLRGLLPTNEMTIRKMGNCEHRVTNYELTRRMPYIAIACIACARRKCILQIFRSHATYQEQN